MLFISRLEQRFIKAFSLKKGGYYFIIDVFNRYLHDRQATWLRPSLRIFFCFFLLLCNKVLIHLSILILNAKCLPTAFKKLTKPSLVDRFKDLISVRLLSFHRQKHIDKNNSKMLKTKKVKFKIKFTNEFKLVPNLVIQPSWV